MIAYRKVKLLEHIIQEGLTNPSKMKVIEGIEDDVKKGIVTLYDKALLTLGFDKYILNMYGVQPTNAWTLHEVYVLMMSEFISEDMLNNFERNLLYKIENEELKNTLHRSKRYINDLEYYKSRVSTTKESVANLAFVSKSINHVILKSEVERLEEETDSYTVMKFENKMKTAKVNNLDKRMLEIYKGLPSLPYSGHIHPNVLLKLSRYLIPYSNKNETLYLAMADNEPTAEFCEVIMMMMLETKLLGCTNIKEYLEPIIHLGEIYSNPVSVAFMVPETPGEPEYIRVAYRYDEDIQITTDRTYFKDITELRGLGVNEQGHAVIKKDGMTVWDALFKGAYKPKNGNYNDIREINLTK